ncbi:MAG: homocysteine S-methyltransferase [Chloroflexota bacterium]|nr:MAG: homocysteine S-methyltransferase [Chloroflexota bacterium]
MDNRSPICPFLDEYGVMILDGGLATELESRGYDLADELWSARVLLEDPEAIRQLHRDYLAAGADCIITASYQGTVAGFMKRGLDEADAEALLRSSVTLAVDARDSFWREPANRIGRRKPIVAASVGPYGAYLADGSEYTGRYDLDEAGLKEFHRRRWQLLAATDADILACETIPSIAECRALAQLLLETPGRWAWFSFSCKDAQHISDGSRLADCLSFLDDIGPVAAVGINCTSPVHVPGLLREARAATAKPLVLYPNSGEMYDAESKRWSGRTDANDFAQSCQEWQAAGAWVIGGCCRTGPEHIRQIRGRLIEDD